ncbi:hypothetical protein R5R35_006192 [Gryllus longicercus]|uniref:Glucuronosyltransferase n=1 Tax=Gryllus longicercus TaxID=2509291 RepID=A0AAN9VF08_9ORTH
MPESTRESFLKCFSKLKQNVLWKVAYYLPGLPSNVRLGKWFPQSDILAHPNVKLFISNAGLMGAEEATYFGVPMVVIPIMFDQHFNALRLQSAGTTLILDARNITEKSLCSAIDEILQNPEYQENAKRLSVVMKDQPQTPMERAIFWAEYSIRHKGAPHLHSPALNLNFVSTTF